MTKQTHCLPQTRIWLLLLCAASVAGCSPSASAQPTKTPEQTLKSFVEILSGCTGSQCGSNSPVVNGFPLNGLKAGVKNPEGVTLINASVYKEPGWKCNGGKLVVNQEGELLVDKGGTICNYKELEGMKFDVRTKAVPATQPIWITNAERSSTDAGQTLHVYRLATWGGFSLCSRRIARTWRTFTRLPALPEVDDLHPFDTIDPKRWTSVKLGGIEVPPEDFAIVQFGELYDFNGEHKPFESKGKDWISFACLRDALAKVHVYGSASWQHGGSTPSQIESRQAALKFTTANYCNGDRYTTSKKEISWMPVGSDGTYPEKGPNASELEAVWGPGGARCITRTRLYNLNKIPAHLIPPNCIKPGGCPDETKFVEELGNLCRPRVTTPCPEKVPGGLFATYKVK